MVTQETHCQQRCAFSGFVKLGEASTKQLNWITFWTGKVTKVSSVHKVAESIVMTSFMVCDAPGSWKRLSATTGHSKNVNNFYWPVSDGTHLQDISREPRIWSVDGLLTISFTAICPYSSIKRYEFGKEKECKTKRDPKLLTGVKFSNIWAFWEPKENNWHSRRIWRKFTGVAYHDVVSENCINYREKLFV